MQPGDVLEGRFELERSTGSGGMGEVFRAWDRASGEAVAIKVLLAGRAPGDARFAREAWVLSELSHPGIVRYVAHGVAPSGAPFLAMEWLSGEDLSARLRRGALTVDETVALGTRAAAALGAVHACGVVHRDLKPSNLFLVGEDVRRVKLLDFGIARRGNATRMTQTGAVLGTAGYMAPEQVQSGGDLDARADVFALGCVLFECLTGAPLFTGEHVMGLLAKILFQEAPRVSEQQAGIPPALSALVARMLAKEREERPRNGAEVAEALRALGTAPVSTAEQAALLSSGPPSALTSSERRVLSVVLVGLEPVPLADVAPTLNEADVTAEEGALREAAEASGGHLTVLADGSAIVTVRGSSQVATDQAAQAARAALSLRALTGDRPMALSTGQAEVTGRLPAGDVIDRAARMLAKLASASHAAREPVSARPIAIDDVTAGLLNARFEVTESAGSFELQGEREIAEGARTLLGQPTACVGRDWELATLEGLLNDCVEEPMARAVLVTAPAGMGKSRLVHELMDRARRRGEWTAIWVGRGDSLRAGSTFGLLGQALRSALGIQQGQPLEARRDKLRVRVAEHVPAEDQRRVAEFLGELVGTPFPEEESVPLRAARQDAQLMGDQMRRAWVDFLQAETAAHPVLLVLEDLHWGDLSTVRFIDTALRDVGGQPWMAIALARPEVHELFPRLWAERRVQELRLKELTRKASERLVRQVLGESVEKETVDRLVVQAEGHAFYLEELIQAEAEGKGAALPETVLAMVEARLSRLEGEVRRVLRAASVFGEVFWQGGVIALLGRSIQPAKTDDWLGVLIAREVLVRRTESRFPGEPEFAFRHALLREGAYAMLTKEDRALGHRLAGRWLEQHGDADPIALAEHFDRGGESARASGFYLRAAEQALRAGEATTAIARVHLGLGCAVPDDVRIALLGMFCEAHGWHIQTVSSVLPYAEELLCLSQQGSAPWAQGVLAKLMATMSAGSIDEFLATFRVLQATEPFPDAALPLTLAFCVGIYLLDRLGRPREAEAPIERLSMIARDFAVRQPLVPAWWNLLMAGRYAYAKEDPYRALEYADTALVLAETFNDGRIILTAQVFRAMNLWFLGALEAASRALEGALEADAALGMANSVRRFSLTWMLADRGAFAEAGLYASDLIASARAQRLPLDEGRGRWSLGEVLRRARELDRADQEIQAALAILEIVSPLDLPGALTTLSALRLAQGRVGEALGAAEEALTRYEAMGTCGFFRGAFLRLVHAEALAAAGQRERACAAIGVARERLLANAAKIGEPGYRKSFLEEVPENARTLALAEAWRGEGETGA